MYDPVSMLLLRTIALSVASADVRGLAVDTAGLLYAAAWNGTIYQLSTTGALLNSHVTGFSDLDDIDIDSTGRLVVGGRFGDVILTTTALSSQTHFSYGSGPVHVAFTEPSAAVPVPEPATMMLLGTGLTGLGFSRRRNGRRHRT